MINWKVRVRQLWFWLTLIPALFLLGDQLWSIWQLLGQIEAGHLSDGPLMQLLLELVGTVFAILVLVGIPVDTTTEGYGDSARALTYTEPAPNASVYGLQEFEEQSAAADAKMVDWGARDRNGTELSVGDLVEWYEDGERGEHQWVVEAIGESGITVRAGTWTVEGNDPTEFEKLGAEDADR